MNRYLTIAVAGLLLLASSAEVSSAQSYDQTARAFVQSPRALGMGDTGVALSLQHTVFFYNPAHVAHVAGRRARFTFAGVRGSMSDNLLRQIDYFQNTLQPAIDEGFDTKSNEELEALYDETLALGKTRTLLNGDVLLPSVMMKVGGVGIGAGVFGHSMVRYRFEDAGAGVPLADLNAMADLIAVGSAGVDLSNFGLPGLTAGVTGKLTHRWMTLKNKALDSVDRNEGIYLLKGSSTGFDVGFLYEITAVPLAGKLSLGFSAYDVVATDFDYTFDSNLAGDEENAELIDEEVQLANDLYSLTPSYRVGAAWSVPGAAGLIKNTAFAADYLWYSNPVSQQEFLTGLHVGVQTQLSVLILRVGINSGYTTLGAGLDFGFVRLDYAYYGVEQGRFPGQLPSWNHTAQLAFGM